MPLRYRAAPLALVLLGPATLTAQARDTLKAVEVESLTVTVTRAPEPLSRTPRAVDVLTGTAVRRGQATLGIDEALANLPGVYVANRYNFSVDQRLSLRGVGSRSSFGSRGVKILLDGVPQTLPDGQSQLTNLDLATIGRIEVLRGASSSLYGNAAGGVLSFTSLPTAPDPASASLRSESGSFGLRKNALRLSGRTGTVAGAVALSHTTWHGFRQHSRYEGTRFDAALDWFASGSTVINTRVRAGDDPVADNPGALDLTELRASRRSAPSNNITRDAGKDVAQQQLSVTIKHFTGGGAALEATFFRFTRSLDNPLASNNWNSSTGWRGGSGSRAAARSAMPAPGSPPGSTSRPSGTTAPTTPPSRHWARSPTRRCGSGSTSPRSGRSPNSAGRWPRGSCCRPAPDTMRSASR